MSIVDLSEEKPEYLIYAARDPNIRPKTLDFLLTKDAELIWFALFNNPGVPEKCRRKMKSKLKEIGHPAQYYVFTFHYKSCEEHLLTEADDDIVLSEFRFILDCCGFVLDTPVASYTSNKHIRKLIVGTCMPFHRSRIDGLVTALRMRIQDRYMILQVY